MKKAIIVLVILLMAQAVMAGQPTKGEAGRYLALKYSDNAIFIVDTMTGDLWIWVQQFDQEVQRSREFLVYQGKAIRGDFMGQVIDKSKGK